SPPDTPPDRALSAGKSRARRRSRRSERRLSSGLQAFRGRPASNLLGRERAGRPPHRARGRTAAKTRLAACLRMPIAWQRRVRSYGRAARARTLAGSLRSGGGSRPIPKRSDQSLENSRDPRKISLPYSQFPVQNSQLPHEASSTSGVFPGLAPLRRIGGPRRARDHLVRLEVDATMVGRGTLGLGRRRSRG